MSEIRTNTVPLFYGSGCGSVPKSSVIFRMQKIYFHILYVLLVKLKSFKIVEICLVIKIKFLARKFLY
jgi:hypothetical protein